MAGGGDESKLTGLSRIFNGETMRGRANVNIVRLLPKLFRLFFLLKTAKVTSFFHLFSNQVAKATYASIGLLILYFSLKPSKK
uniref:Uncharacterized protein n=1 Tax=Anopheles coluzzii TaxID=1518534 RepID=A0A8W7Q3X7_ANOCL